MIMIFTNGVSNLENRCISLLILNDMIIPPDEVKLIHFPNTMRNFLSEILELSK